MSEETKNNPAVKTEARGIKPQVSFNLGYLKALSFITP